ncbi:MAG: hypothetical protein E6I26_14385 [Chloroflexi bacterium]|nr:MAG: hypothetical protein E6I26_14385 [Chloroflexota bacterium]
MYVLDRNAESSDRQIITALDSAGHVRNGWPIEAAAGSEFGPLVAGPDASLYVEERRRVTDGNVLHRLDASGRDSTGWPFDIPPSLACPTGNTCYPALLSVASDGTAYVRTQGGPRVQALAVDGAGAVKPGWPIELPELEWSGDQLGPDGTVFLVGRPAGTPTFDPTRGVVDEGAELWAFGSDGRPRPGWPMSVPNIRGFLISPQGDIVISGLIDDVGELCNNPRRTVFTVVAPDGRTRPGWPRGSTGLASLPVVGADGTVYYMSATKKVYAHDQAGVVRPGWPVEVPGGGDGCGPERPHLAPDGTLFAVGDVVLAMSADGTFPAGWPYRPSGETIGPCFDSECLGGHGTPAFGPDGSVYLIVFGPDAGGVRAEVVALDRLGRLKPGWPYRLPFDAKTTPIGTPTVTPDGRVFIRAGSSPALYLALDPDGTLSD